MPLHNVDRRTGRTAVCAWVPLNASSPAIRVPIFCLLDTATSTSKRGRRFNGTTLLIGAQFWYTGQDHLQLLGTNSAHTSSSGQYIVHFLDDPGPAKLALSFTRYTTALGAVRGSGCLKVHQGTSLIRDIARNVDESRGAELAGSADLNTSP